MNIIKIKTDDLIEYANNPRNIAKAIDVVAKSIKEFGFRVPVVVDKNNTIVAGHVRVNAAKKLGIAELPCIVADDLTEEQVKAYRIADNQVGAFATWDEEKLAAELDALGLDMSDYGFCIEKALKNSAEEIRVDDFDDKEFDTECPYCGFRFNR